jgi:hypothetical protein
VSSGEVRNLITGHFCIAPLRAATYRFTTLVERLSLYPSRPNALHGLFSDNRGLIWTLTLIQSRFGSTEASPRTANVQQIRRRALVIFDEHLHFATN